MIISVLDIKYNKFCNYIDGKEPEDDFTKELDDAVNKVKSNEKWRLEYMTLQMSCQEKYEMSVKDGIEQGIASLVKLCKKMNGSIEDAVETVMSEYGFTEKKARDIIGKYW